jgi:hypothetical protein
MKIFIFADPHYSSAEVTNRTRRPSLSLEKLRTLSPVITGCDRIICLGDIVDGTGSAETDAPYLSVLSSFLHSFGVPVDAIMGNHDCRSFTEEEFCRIGSFRKAPYVTFCGGGEVCSLGASPDAALIFLDANYLSDGGRALCEHSDWTDANLPESQLTFLAGTLSALPDGTEAYIFIHQCLDPGVESRHIIKNAPAVRNIIEANREKVAAVIEGHYHKGAENIVGGVKYITLPAMCELDAKPYLILET